MCPVQVVLVVWTKCFNDLNMETREFLAKCYLTTVNVILIFMDICSLSIQIFVYCLFNMCSTMLLSMEMTCHKKAFTSHM